MEGATVIIILIIALFIDYKNKWGVFYDKTKQQ